MRRVIAVREVQKYTAGAVKRIQGEKVRNGQILEVNAICAGFENIVADEIVEIQIDENGLFIPLHKEAVRVASEKVNWTGQVVIGEGDKIVADFANVADTEKMYLSYFGVLYDEKTWRQEKG